MKRFFLALAFVLGLTVASYFVVYRDRVSGERLEPVAKLVPLAPATSRLPFAVENLRFCPWCGQMAQYDHNDCPTCGRRMDPPPASEHSATAQH